MPKHGSINLYVHGNHWEGSLGRTAGPGWRPPRLFCHSSWTKTGGGGRGRSYTHRYTVTTTRMIRWAAMRAILIVRDKVTTGPAETVSTNHNFWRERRVEAVSNRGPYHSPAYRLTARPNRLSKDTMNSSKKYGAASHYFYSCANKEATDHYSQSRCANKNPRATIRTAALPIRIHFW